MTPALYSLFVAAAIKHGVGLSLLLGICSVESDFRPNVIVFHDGKGARHSFGICQVQYETARDYGLFHNKYCETGPYEKCPLSASPAINIEYAARYIKYQLRRYDYDELKAISAYNAGTFTRKNKRYVDKVRQRMEQFSYEETPAQKE